MKLRATKRRKIIEKLFREERFDEISRALGIEINERYAGGDCISYVNQRPQYIGIGLCDFDFGAIPPMLEEIFVPEENSLAVYYLF
jgi:hypothetical protein